MAKKIIIVVLALGIGAFLAFLTLFYLKPKNNEKTLFLTVLQTGAYSSYENALTNKELYPDAIIISDGSLYRVLVGAAASDEAIIKIANILNSKNIHFYQKETDINVTNNDLIYKYNLLLEKTTDEEAILEINRQILNKVSSV